MQSLGAPRAAFVAVALLALLLVAVQGVQMSKQSQQQQQLVANAPVGPRMLALVEQTLKLKTHDEEAGPLNMRVYDITSEELCAPLSVDASGTALEKVEFCKEVVQGQQLCTPDIDDTKLADEFKKLDHDAIERYLEWVEALPEEKRKENQIRALVKKYACLASGFFPKPNGRGDCSVIDELASIGIETKTAPLIQMTAENVALPAPEGDQAFFYLTTTAEKEGNPACPQVPVNPPENYNVMLVDPTATPVGGEMAPNLVSELQEMAESMKAFLVKGIEPTQFSELKPAKGDLDLGDANAVTPQELISKFVETLKTTNFKDLVVQAMKTQHTSSVSSKGATHEERSQSDVSNGRSGAPVVASRSAISKGFLELEAKASSKAGYNVVAAGKVPHDQIIKGAAALTLPPFLYDNVFWKGTRYPDTPEEAYRYLNEPDWAGRHIAPAAWYKDIANVDFNGVVGKLRNCGKLMKANNIKSKIRYNWINCMNWKVNYREQPWHSSATPMKLLRTDKVDAVTEFETAQNTRQAEINRSMSGLKYKASITNRQARHLAVGAILRWVNHCLKAIRNDGNEAAVIQAINRQCNRNAQDNAAACMCKSLLGHAMHTIADSFPPSHTHRANLQANLRVCQAENLRTYTIEDFYSVDVQDPYRHKQADNVYEDGFAKCAMVASAGLINIVFDDRHNYHRRLHIARDYLCQDVYPVRPEKLGMPAGGAPASLSGNFLVQKPTLVVRVPGDDKDERTAIATDAWTLNGNHLAQDPNVNRQFNPWREEWQAANPNAQPGQDVLGRDFHEALPDDVPYDDLALEQLWQNQDVCA